MLFLTKSKISHLIDVEESIGVSVPTLVRCIHSGKGGRANGGRTCGKILRPSFEDRPEPVPPDIDQSFLQEEEGGFHGFDPPQVTPDEINVEGDPDSGLPFEAEDASTQLIPVDSQATRFGRVSRRRSDPDYVNSSHIFLFSSHTTV